MFRISLFLFFPAASIFAENFTLAEALRRAGESHPALLAQDTSVRAAAALIGQAGMPPNPVVELGLENFAGRGALRGLDASETTLRFSQTLEAGGKREKRAALARREHAFSEGELAARRAEVRAATVTAFVEVVAAQQRAALAAESAALAAEVAAELDARTRSATASPAEAARARAALALSRAESRRADAALAAARAALAAQWSGTVADVPPLAAALPVPDAPPEAAPLAARLAAHPRLLPDRARIEARRAALQLEQARAKQDLTVAGGLRFLSDGSDAGFIAGVSMPIPFRGQNQGDIRAARETLAGAEQAASGAEIAQRAAFSAAWSALSAAIGVAQELRRDALPAAKEAHDAVHQAWLQGEAPFHAILEARRDLSSLRREILVAETECALALVRLEALADPGFPLTTSLLSVR